MAENICKSTYNFITNSLLSTFYLIELGTYLAATVAAYFIVEELSFNVYLSKTYINCGVDGDNDENTCQANTESDSQYKVRFDYFIMVVLALNVITSFGLLLVEQRRVRTKEISDELFNRQANDWLEVPGTIGLFLLISVMSGVTEIYQLFFITGFLLFNAILETLFVSYRLSSVDYTGKVTNRNIMLKYLTTFHYILILLVLSISFVFLLANSSDFTLLWGIPIFVTAITTFFLESSKYFFYYTILPAEYKLARETISQNQSLVGVVSEISQKSPSDLLTFFSKQKGMTRKRINNRIFFHQLIQRMIILFWKLMVFGLVWFGTNNYKINFV